VNRSESLSPTAVRVRRRRIVPIDRAGFVNYEAKGKEKRKKHNNRGFEANPLQGHYSHCFKGWI